MRKCRTPVKFITFRKTEKLMKPRGIPGKHGGHFDPRRQGSKGSGEIVQKGGNGSTIQFYSVTEKKKIHVPRNEVTFTKNKRGQPAMIAKGKGVRADGTTFDLHRTGHA